MVLFSIVTSANAYNLTNYYPLNQGDTWTYSTIWGGYEETEVVLIDGTETFGSVDAVKMYFYYGAYDWEYNALLWTVEGQKDYKWVWDNGTEYEIYTEPITNAPVEMSIGQTHQDFAEYIGYWNDIQDWTGNETTTLTLLGVETITVPAGTFEALKFTYTNYWFDDEGGWYGTDSAVNWLAEGIGIIKEIGNETEYDPDEDETYIWDYSMELINATIDGVSYPHLPIVSGYVFNSSGNPLANVPVELWGETIWREDTTNAEGHFEFNVPQGEYGLYINMDGSILEGYTEADIGEDTPPLDVTSDIEINLTLWKINVILETEYSNYNKGDIIEVNVTVTNNEDEDIENWEVGTDLYFWNETDEGYLEDYYQVNISSSEKKSFLLYLEIPQNIVYDNWNLWGWVWKYEVEFKSSKGPLQGEIGKEVGKEINITKPKFNIHLSEGWNLISSPLNFTNLTEIFLPIQPYFVSLFAYDEENQKHNSIDPFTYNGPVDKKSGAWIKVSQATTWSITGTEFASPIDITLYPGRNLIGWPSLEESTITNTDFENNTIYSYNGTWASYIPNRAFNTLTTFTPGYGYWVKEK